VLRKPFDLAQLEAHAREYMAAQRPPGT
jgi:hypothetical protein